MSEASQKRHPFNPDSTEGTGKNRLETGQESVGDATVLSHCYFLRNHLPKPTVMLERFRAGETNCWFSICGASPSDHILITFKNVTYISLFTAVIPQMLQLKQISIEYSS